MFISRLCCLVRLFLECLTIQRIVQTPLQWNVQWEYNCFELFAVWKNCVCRSSGFVVHVVGEFNSDAIRPTNLTNKTHSRQVANLGKEMQFSSKYTLCSFPCLDRSVSTATLWRAEKFPNQMIKHTQINTESKKKINQEQKSTNQKITENRRKIITQNYNWNCL